jgi:hypothetical protein
MIKRPAPSLNTRQDAFALCRLRKPAHKKDAVIQASILPPFSLELATLWKTQETPVV